MGGNSGGIAGAVVGGGIGSVVDATGIGALTGTGLNTFSTLGSAAGYVAGSGGVKEALGNIASDAITQGMGDLTGIGSDVSDLENMYQAPEIPSEMQLSNSSSTNSNPGLSDFKKGLTTNESTFAVDENGDWDPSASLQRAAGRWAQNKTDNIIKGNTHYKPGQAEEDLKRLMAQTMMQE